MREVDEDESGRQPFHAKVIEEAEALMQRRLDRFGEESYVKGFSAGIEWVAKWLESGASRSYISTSSDATRTAAQLRELVRRGVLVK